MITRQKAVTYQVGDLKFDTLKAAQEHELAQFFPAYPEICVDIANRILKNSDLIVDILTTTDKSIPKARAVNGGRKPRKAKVAPATDTLALATA